MKVLVTGGAGFIGSHLVDKLAEKGHGVVVIDNLEPQVHMNKKPTHLNPKAKYFFDDIGNEKILKETLKDTEIVFHLAASVGIGQSMYQIKKYVDTNSLGTAKLLQAIIDGKYDVKKLVVASSFSVYGEGAYECEDCREFSPDLRNEEQLKAGDWEIKCPNCKKTAKPVPTREDKPPNPTSIYTLTKLDQEKMCLLTGKAYGISTVVLRYFNTYGPRQSLSNPYTGVTAIFSSRIKSNKPPLIFEDGRQTRDMISVHDIVNANILVMNNKRADYQVFNIGTGASVSILELAKTLIGLYKKNIKPEVSGKYRKGDIRHCVADISKIKELGFKPTVSFREGMLELVKWGRKKNAIDQTDHANEELVSRGLL